VLTPAALLSLVGLGGVVGLLVQPATGFAVVAIATSVLYVLFFVLVWRGMGPRARSDGWPLFLFFGFGAATLAYIVPYLVGFPRTRDAALLGAVALEQWFYLAGNVLTKMLLPLAEYALVVERAPPPSAGNDALLGRRDARQRTTRFA